MVPTNDCGPLILENVQYSDGNLSALLRIRVACGYKYLIDQLENKKLNASYLSSLFQNNFIDTCGKIVQEQIV